MKKLIAVVLLAVVSNTYAQAQEHMVDDEWPRETCEMWDEFTQDQIKVIVHSYFRGKDHNMQRTLAAIAIVESEAGEIPVNLSDPSAGIHHITIRNALTYLDLKDTGYNRNRVAARLIANPNLSADFALTTLQWWHDYHDGNWDLTWRSYNGGYDWYGSNATRYTEKIGYWVDRLGECGWR